MGYVVHITRAEDWARSEQNPILASEWMAVVNSDPTLQVSDKDYYDTAAKDGSRERHLVVLWLAHPNKPFFGTWMGKLQKRVQMKPRFRKWRKSLKGLTQGSLAMKAKSLIQKN